MRLPTLALICLTVLAGAAWTKPDASADLVAGIAAYNQGAFATALRLLQAASDRGEAEAMVNLGYMYARGHGVESDPDFALQLYRQAAAAGDGEGMNAVGYRYNFAAKPDLDNAVQWYCRAVLRGNPRAMNNLALLFYRGDGVPRDVEEARDLWRQAYHRGSIQAQTNLGADLAADATLPLADRQGGYEMLLDAARKGGILAQQILRKSGSSEVFPPATVDALTMRLEPRDELPGTSHACGELIS